MNILETECTQCVFHTNDSCCIEKNTQNNIVEGFCRFKRLGISNDIESSFGIAFMEESCFSCVILAIDLDLEKLAITIDNIVSQRHLNVVSDIFVFLHNRTAEEIKSVNKLLEKTRMPWWIHHNKEDYIDKWAAVDSIANKVSENWFLTIEQGDSISSESFNKIEEVLSDKQKNAVCLYFDQENPIKVLCSKYAFGDLRGHIEIPWLDKVRTFDNWQEVCVKI